VDPWKDLTAQPPLVERSSLLRLWISRNEYFCEEPQRETKRVRENPFEKKWEISLFEKRNEVRLKKVITGAWSRSPSPVDRARSREYLLVEWEKHSAPSFRVGRRIASGSRRRRDGLYFANVRTISRRILASIAPPVYPADGGGM
jgi:hypothetical protein